MNDTLVLCYHAVSEDWPADLAVSPSQLEEQVRYLIGRGYRATTFTDAVTGHPKGRTLVITFDDAFRSVAELGFPVLDRLGVPGTVFVPTAFVEGGTLRWPGIDQWEDGPYSSELATLSWEALRDLAAAGWEIGSHSRTHRRLSQLDDSGLARELEESKEECEGVLGAPCTSIAYPFGDADARVLAGAARAGYRAGAALSNPPQPHHPLEWPRLAVSRGDSARRFRRLVSPAVRRLRDSPVGPAVDGGYAWLLSTLRWWRR